MPAFLLLENGFEWPSRGRWGANNSPTWTWICTTSDSHGFLMTITTGQSIFQILVEYLSAMSILDGFRFGLCNSHT